MSVNEEKLQSFVMEKVLPETAAAMSVVIAIIGDKLGLFKEMDGAGPMSPAGLADKTGTTERYVREWLSAMAAAGWIDYHAGDETFELTPEQAMVFANDDSPYNLQGAFQIIGSTFRDHNLNVEAFRTGEGIAWGDHSQCLFGAVERFFRVKYVNQLVSKWLPALDGVVGKLEAGAKFADVGCGHAVTTLVMGRAFPNSEFVGYDFHGPSIERARELAAGEGLANLSFEVATAKDYPGRDFDIVAFFDCLHDMGDPVGACQHAKSTLRPDGTLMVVEPFAMDRLEDNFTPIGRMAYGASTCICTPASLSQEVGLGLGAQAGPARMQKVTEEAGFSNFRVAFETANNLVLEARP